MSNKEFAELLINSIQEHKEEVCGERQKDMTPEEKKEDVATQLYALAHDHIIQLIRLECELNYINQEDEQ